jgi:monoamine oxidase
MDRRDFIKKAAWSSLGGVFIPSSLLASCRKVSLYEDFNFKGKVLIVGAGAAGLYAAYLLKSKGIDFQILEASDAYGGRMGRITDFADFPIDSGAQWLHGKNSILGDLAQRSQTKITLDDTGEVFWFQNQLVSTLPKDIAPVFTREKNIPDVSFQEFAIQEGFGEEYANIVENIAGDSGADASLISAYWKIQEEENWVAGDDDYKFQESFFDFIDTQIAAGVKDKITLNTVVKSIDYSQDTVVVIEEGGAVYTADRVIVTVPISLLKLDEIVFYPTLPSAKKDAFSKIGMGAGMKVFLKFSSKFYDENIIGGAVCAAYAEENIGKKGTDAVLLAFIMGEQAAYLSGLGNDAAITAELLQELDSMYDGQATSLFLNSRVIDWTTRPFIKGAYSFSTVGMGNAREIAAQSLQDKVFFAGEAMNVTGHHQTVHGAVESGYSAVLKLLKTARK